MSRFPPLNFAITDRGAGNRAQRRMIAAYKRGKRVGEQTACVTDPYGPVPRKGYPTEACPLIDAFDIEEPRK